MRKFNPIPPNIGEYISYCPKTGQFTRIKGSKKKCGYVNNGYLTIEVQGVPYRAHRIAWFLSYGEDPEYIVDHFDRDRLNNKLSNLRIASDSMNRANSQFTGVQQRKSGRWRARIQIGSKRKTIGTFDTYQEAREAYRQAKLKYHSVSL